MDDTRHVASWIGGQEALHDRVLTLEEALAAVEAVDAAAVQALAGAAVPRRRAAARRGRPGALPARPRAAPAAAGMTAPAITGRRPAADAGRDGRAGPGPRAPSARLAVAGPGRARDDGRSRRCSMRAGLVDLAEVRWRTGDLLGAGEAANAALREDGRRGRSRSSSPPRRRRRSAARARRAGWPTGRWRGAPAQVDRIFAGMPRSSVWPADAAEPPPTAPTLFDREP